MKILLVITGLGMGGAERQVVDLADRFADEGHDVLILVLTGQPVIQPSRTQVGLHLLGMRKSPVDVVKSIARARALLQAFKPDVVHSHMRHANLFARLLRVVTPMPRLISTSHTSNDGGRLWMWAYRWTDRFSDLTTNVSEAAAEAFRCRRAAPPDKLAVVYNGIDTEHFQFSLQAREALRSDLLQAPSTTVFLAIGRLTEAKDYPTLLSAFARVQASRDAVLWIVGSGPLEAMLKRMALDLAVAHKVVFLGTRSDIPQLLSAADVFVLSSRWEGFGLVVAEAMACKRPVVATAAYGVTEVLGNEGWLVQPENVPALGDAMMEAANTDAQCLALQGESAKERVRENFSISVIVRHWLKIYAMTGIGSNALDTKTKVSIKGKI